MITIVPAIRRLVVRAVDLLSLLRATRAEVRENRRKLEADLFRNRYHISSKNDDALSIGR